MADSVRLQRLLDDMGAALDYYNDHLESKPRGWRVKRMIIWMDEERVLRLHLLKATGDLYVYLWALCSGFLRRNLN